MKRGKWILKALVAGFVFILVAGTVVMLLWNWLVPSLFNGPAISFLQALGLLLLSKILFSGWGGHRWRHAGGPPWRQRLHEKWSSMTPEERERFKSRMREKWCQHPSEGRDQNAGSSNV
jgi:hypothetical protein